MLAALATQSAPPATRGSGLTLDSSDARLVHAFEWAKRQALAYAFEGDPVGLWYEAALPGREAFCMRDVAHQAMGAHALGLAPYTANMLRRFAQNISESRDWCSYWEIDRYNRPAPVDYKNDGEFWYCLPANYDVLDCCYRMYLWTGDAAYIDDPVFLNFYDRTMTDYEERWSLDSTHVMRRKRLMNIRGEFAPDDKFQFFRGIPSYQESEQGFVVGVDLLATQYAGYLAYAAIQDSRRNDRLAHTYAQKASVVKALINDTWWNENEKQFYSRVNKNYQLEGRDISAVLYRNAANDGPKLQGAVDKLIAQIKSVPSSAVEGESHNPEILYRYGVPDLAYSQIMDLTREDRERREYPEVSYSVVGAIVTGLMGITVDAKWYALSGRGDFVDRMIKTLPELGNIAWAELRNLPVRSNEVNVRHEGISKTVLTNQKGPTLIWRAAFSGAFTSLQVNGKPMRAQQEKGPRSGEVSYVDLPVAPSTTATVEVPN
ncbi:MAG: hypothetical protein JO033_13645 [Acidobacteriaceae bacterium]|nr:hypothetical protein [Acidobacteriaceae bacterium]